MLVHELMTTTVHFVAPDATIDDVVRLLSKQGLTSVPVVLDGEVVGIVSEADLIPVLVTADPRAHLIPVPAGQERQRFVRDVMTKDPYVTRGDADVGDLSQVMAKHGWKSVPVVLDNELVGMVSRSDIVRALDRPDADIQHELLELLSELGHPQWQVSMVAGEAQITGPITSREHAVASAVALSVNGVRGVR